VKPFSYYSIWLIAFAGSFLFGCNGPEKVTNTDDGKITLQPPLTRTFDDIRRVYGDDLVFPILRAWKRESVFYNRLAEDPPVVILNEQVEDCLLSRLETLDLLAYELTNEVRAAVDKCTSLQWLRVRITNIDQIRWLGTKSQLRGLSLYFSFETPQTISLDPLAGLNGLVWLNLCPKKAKLTKLPYLHCLEILSIKGATDDNISWSVSPSLRVLELPFSKLSTEGIRKLTCNFRNLEFLELYGAKTIDSRAVSYLANLKNLKRLGIGLTEIQSEEFRMLRNAMPNCEIDTAD
jgi:hypothetical protein